MDQGTDRREVPQRTQGWAVRIADVLAAMRLTPNAISLLSVVFALLAAVGLVASGFSEGGARAGWLVLAALAIPVRLACNMLDGMLAVERGMTSPTGELFNELPDRVADLLVIAAAGYAVTGLWVAGAVDLGQLLGWVAASTAVLTAYVRTLGASCGVGNFFGGPMAKPHRMWVLAGAALLSLLEGPLGWPVGVVLLVGLAVVALGSAATVVVRLRSITGALVQRAAGESV